MFNRNGKILFVFKKDINGYKFHSMAVANVNEAGEAIIQSGIYKDKTMFFTPWLIDPSNNCLVDNGIANLSNSSNDFSTMDDYVIYKIPISLQEILEEYQFTRGNGVACEILCELGRTTQFTYDSKNRFFSTHTKPQKYQEEIEDIIKLLKGESLNLDHKNNREMDESQRDNEEERVNNKTGFYFNGKIIGSRNIEPVAEVDEKLDYAQIAKKESILKINVNQIIDAIKNKIVGQDEAVEAVVANIFANQMLIDTGNRDLISTQKAAILIDGPTGTGKTAIVKEVAHKLEIPMVDRPSTSFSATGYVGDSITEILVKLYKEAKGDLDLAQRGVVCIDEIDKLGGFSKEKELSMRKAVQQELLTFISGAKYTIEIDEHTKTKIEFDTTNLTFISLGAFTSIRDKKIEENRNKQKTKLTIGFASTLEKTELEEEKNYVMNEQDYIEYGLERELIGRISLFASTKAYTKDGYRRILLESEISPLKAFIDFAKSFGVEEVIYDDEFIEKVCEMAYEANFGARGLHQIISNLKNILLIDLINDKNKTITLTVDMLDKVKEKNIRTY